jgi:putative membrane protein
MDIMSKSTISGAGLMLAAACMALAVAAAEVGTRTQNANSGSMANGNANANHGAGHMTSDEKFAMEAAVGGMEEVQLGQLAAQKGASDEVRQFGQKMVDDHSKANQDLMQVASGKGWTLPTALDAKHQADVQKLSALTGDAFDRAYVKMMVSDHKKDVGEFQKESARGMDADVKSFATRTLPTLQEHLQMIQRINDKMTLRKSGNLSNSNSGGGMGGNMNSNMGGSMNSNSGGNSNSNRGKGSNRNSNGNSNTGSNTNNSNM